MSISIQERNYLRKLACQVAELATLPIMHERRNNWYMHNALQHQKPLIIMEIESFCDDLLPSLQCSNEAAKKIEKQLLSKIVNHELINDDKVIDDVYIVSWELDFLPFGFPHNTQRARDEAGRELGYADVHYVTNLKDDLETLKPSTFGVNRLSTQQELDFTQAIIGDILPVKLANSSINWFFGITAWVVKLMGMENMFFAIMDTPEEMKKFLQLIRDEMINFLHWLENENLLTFNHGNVYTGSGSYGFSHELVSNDFDGIVHPWNMWGNTNSQESVGVSPDDYEEFFFPVYCDIAEEFGLMYYGCCEAVDTIWDRCLKKLPNLRKVSISPWSNEKIMGEFLSDRKFIYCRKPSPNFIGVGSFDEDAFRKHITKTLEFARNCEIEFSFRDIYTLGGDKGKASRAVKIVRELIEKYYR